MSERDPESSENLLQYLEHVSGRKLRTREDIRRFLDETANRNPEANPALGLWQTLKQGMWLALLTAAYLQFYFLDVLNQIHSIPEIRVNLPLTKLQGKSSPRI